MSANYTSWTNNYINSLAERHYDTFSRSPNKQISDSRAILGSAKRVYHKAAGVLVSPILASADTISEIAHAILKTLGAFTSDLINPLLSLAKKGPIFEQCTRTVIIEHCMQAGKHALAVIVVPLIVLLFDPEEAAKAMFGLENENRAILEGTKLSINGLITQMSSFTRESIRKS